MINFTQIQIFIAIVESGGFIAAGQRMYRSQPAITNAIKKLENRLGFELFDRTHYRPHLTAKGESFYQKSRELVSDFTQLQNSIEQLRSGIETQFAIDLDICLPLTIYTPLIESFIKTYPETCFSLSNNTFVKCIDRLEKKESNISVAASHIHYPNIEYMPMSSICMVPVTSKSYYDQNKEQINNPKNSVHCMQIMIADTQQELQELNIEPLSHSMPKWLVGDMFTRKLLILLGMGIGRLPDHLIEKELTEGTLVKLDSKEYVSVTMKIFAMRLIHREQGVISNSLWEALQNLKLT